MFMRNNTMFKYVLNDFSYTVLIKRVLDFNILLLFDLCSIPTPKKKLFMVCILE